MDMANSFDFTPDFSHSKVQSICPNRISFLNEDRVGLRHNGHSCFSELARSDCVDELMTQLTQRHVDDSDNHSVTSIDIFCIVAF